jgi:FMN phosphatase YigB (HAD superfamily)
VASEIGSYKPARGHWRAFYEFTRADPKRHVHVAQSHFHDIAPAHELGIRSVWVNRSGEHAEAAPTREVPDLCGLPDVLDDPRPFIWHKTADEILDSLASHCQRISDSGH